MKRINQNLVKHHFEITESYQHKYAKQVLKSWILSNNELVNEHVIKIVEERAFCMCGFVIFRPDLTVYNEDGVRLFIEVLKTHPVLQRKIELIKMFLKFHDWNCRLIEIKASWIMDQIKIPNKLKFNEFDI